MILTAHRKFCRLTLAFVCSVVPLVAYQTPMPPAKAGVAELRTALIDFAADFRGERTLSEAEAQQRYDIFQANWPAAYADIGDEVLAYIAAYEDRYPPLFQSERGLNVGQFNRRETMTYMMKQWLHDEIFEAATLDQIAGVAFEESAIFPGPVASHAPRVNVSVPVQADYQTDHRFHLNGEEHGLIRMTGYYAAPGELVTVTLAPEHIGLGLQVLVGIHQDDLSLRMPSFNRFPRVGKRFALNAIQTKVANPFGGGLYIVVPDGAAAGVVPVGLTNVVKTPHFANAGPNLSDAASWRRQLAETGVKWVDIEGRYFMTTLPVSMVAGLDDPTLMVDRWSRAIALYTRIAGRPTATRFRAEYLTFDRQLAHPGTALPAQYPVVAGHGGVPFSGFAHGFSPMRALDGLPHSTVFHELGHLHNMPTLRLEIESNVHLAAVQIYQEIFGLSLDQALLESSYQDLTRDLAALDWMISPNFRAGRRIGHDNQSLPGRTLHELQYQTRGHAKWVDFADLFGWDAIYAMNYPYFEQGVEGFPFNSVPDDEYIINASRAINVNLAPLFAFWGILPSAQADAALAELPVSMPIYRRLLHYRAVVPRNTADFEHYYQRTLGNVDIYQQPRWDAVRAGYDENDALALLNCIDALIQRYFPEQDAACAAATPVPDRVVPVCMGERLTLTAPRDEQVTGYLWYRDNVPLYAERGPHLTIASADSDSLGVYEVALAGTCRSEDRLRVRYQVIAGAPPCRYDRLSRFLPGWSSPQHTPMCAATQTTLLGLVGYINRDFACQTGARTD